MLTIRRRLKDHSPLGEFGAAAIRRETEAREITPLLSISTIGLGDPSTSEQPGLDEAGLRPYFRALVDVDQVLRGKPAPFQHFKERVAQHLGEFLLVRIGHGGA